MAEKMKLFVDENIAYAKFFFEDEYPIYRGNENKIVEEIV